MSHNGHTMKIKEILKATGAKDWKEAVTRFGYGEMFGLDPDQFFDFRVRLTNPEEVHRIISLIESYNDFEGEPLAEALSSLMADGKIMYVEFGRAGSPELHVFVRNPEVNKGPMTEVLRKFGPSELDEYGPYGIRAWWD